MLRHPSSSSCCLQHRRHPRLQHRGSPIVRLRSLSPEHEEDVPLWHEAKKMPLPSSQDWRAFRAHLVSLERTLWPQQHMLDPHPHPGTSGLCSGSTTSAPAPLTLQPGPQRPSAPRRRNASPGAAGNTPPVNNTSNSTSDTAQEPTGWAHLLAGPEVGCVLVACQDHGQMGFFHRSVVLITSHDDAQGTIGLVLNKPTPLLIDEVTTTTDVQGFSTVFGKQKLHLGGPVHTDHMTVLHGFRGLPGTTCLAEGLYTGGVAGATQLVQAGLASPSQFFLSMGVSTWRPRQLSRELSAGCWYCVAASPDLLLPPAQLGEHLPHLSSHENHEGRDHVNAHTTTHQNNNRRTSGAASAGSSSSSNTPNRRRKVSPSSSSNHSGAGAAVSRPATPRQVYALRHPGHSHGVPPLRPPPQHPSMAGQETCLWRRIMQQVHLL